MLSFQYLTHMFWNSNQKEVQKQQQQKVTSTFKMQPTYTHIIYTSSTDGGEVIEAAIIPRNK